ncbi:alpha-(1,3)-fucosyltransferase C-like isoform X1 [Maniola hyperantus]|uniref:alpha-(1,3)-fucosyltransferase C-like isoform X1 n=1 Tax=Aphantopus hyperantus TaxID=2795564 RepID=UPI0015685131|nr:alpha-(1,3)-fucosyltransferase C-like isoform X1 [Maniola hyperantus]XP_034836465.1 alpha-(1,3)-fucosyltransferase C-like isoform X1 [Maniola hyperantus]XP_034836466.1 alpha-(1,3)-fucosyltransferase C-like isoform X1 [Maniola hyperantus]XP_034836467.1 alpha-(1,3)-fucosyltransferase C-like isoform X1 [Maniola hyperantus]
MPRCIQMRRRIESYLRQMQTIRFLLLITCISLTLSVIWIQLVDSQKTIFVNESLIHEVIKNVARDYRYAEVYRRTDKLPSNVKHILLWTEYDFAPFYYFGKGQKAFIDKNCSVINCYVTTDRDYFNGDVSKFDYIFFNGRNINPLTKADLPQNRSSRQKYIYFNMESAENIPVCSAMYDDFFNATATYRLDSDIPIPYIQIKDIYGEVIGPRAEMDWIEGGAVVDENLALRLRNKTKAVAWFVSNCKSRNNRQEYVKKLQQALVRYNLNVDIYGKCGPLTCPRKQKNCSTILDKDYFFYLSFENSFSDDYVTEKLITALQHDVVPIVFGGADYSRFLPPGSYLNARDTTPTELAATIAHLMNSYTKYSRFFGWKQYYSFRDPSNNDNVCSVCKALNEESMEKPKYYKQFRSWWLPNFGERCR